MGTIGSASMKSKQKRQQLARCQVCGAERLPECIDAVVLDVGERFGLEGSLFVAIEVCIEPESGCGEKALREAIRFKNGDPRAFDCLRDAIAVSTKSVDPVGRRRY